MKQSTIYVGSSIVLFIISILFTLSLFPKAAFSQGAGVAMTGYAWSETTGWIDLNCVNSGICASNPFGFFVATDGSVTGYAWSENIGWISANSADLAGCPTAPCTANLSSSALTGWLRVISGNTAESGGWDGFISLSGTGYGVTYSNGNFAACAAGTSCAWGDTSVGWVDFSQARTTFNTCSASSVWTCTGAGNNTITRTDTNTSCSATVTYPTTCVSPQFCSPGSSVCLTPQPTAIPTGSGNTAFTGNLQTRPNLVPKNGSTTVAWNISNVSSCVVTGTNGDSWSGISSTAASCTHASTNACVSSVISSQTTFTLSCVALDSAIFTQTATVNVVPGFEETCAPGDIHVGGKCVRQ